VRPYALTHGRTQPAGETAPGLLDVVVATGPRDSEGIRPSPEQRRILGLCGKPVTVADLASDIDLPVGVVRVLVGDLAQHSLVEVTKPAGPAASERLLREVLDGLQAL
jgi:uncharacterized lipoprotein